MMDQAQAIALRKKLLTVGIFGTGLLAGVLIMQFVGRGRVPAPLEVQTVSFHQNAETGMKGMPAFAGALELNEQFKQVASEVKRSVVSIHSASSWLNVPCALLKGHGNEYGDRENLGSGVLVSPQGHVVTNYHLVEDACELRVTFADKAEYAAEVVGVDESTDLAVVKIALDPDEGRSPVLLGNSTDVQTGEWVLAVGNPLMLTSTVTAGIVSALGRRVDVIEDEFQVEDFIQTDAAINPGNSGGALVNLRGELIGINTAIATHSGYNEGYGFAIPVNLMKRVIPDLIAYGSVRRGYAGMSFDRVDASFARDLGLPSVKGVYVGFVLRNGAAFQAGLREGDVILDVDGIPVNEPNELQSLIAQRYPGDELRIATWRRRKQQNFTIKLLGEDDPVVGEWVRTMSPSASFDQEHSGVFVHVDRWGFALRPLRDSEQEVFGIEEGVFVLFVRPGSVADAAGISGHLALVQVNRTAVSTVGQAVQLANRGRSTLLTVVDKSGQREDIRLTEQ